MPDARVVSYLRENAGRFPPDTLKSALLKQGFSQDEIESAAKEAERPPGGILINAAWMLRDPKGLFSSLDPGTPLLTSAAAILVWAFTAGALRAVFTGRAVELILAPAAALAFSFIGAGLYHSLCRLSSGNARYRGSYAVLANIALLLPLEAALSPIPFSSLAIRLYAYYLCVSGAVGHHKIEPVKAWAVLSVPFLLGTIPAIFSALG